MEKDTLCMKEDVSNVIPNSGLFINQVKGYFAINHAKENIIIKEIETIFGKVVDKKLLKDTSIFGILIILEL